MMRRLALLLPLLLACDNHQATAPTTTPLPPFEITIVTRCLWFYDSLCTEYIWPALTTCDTLGPGVLNCSSPEGYKCTVLPDTFWGWIEHDQYDDTLHCAGATCVSSMRTIPLTTYRLSLIDTSCSQ